MKQAVEGVRRDWHAAIEHEVRDKRIPSISYALVDREGILVSGHAIADDLSYAVTDDSVFRVGSCSKMFTGIALMQFADQGKVDIDSEVSEYVPGFAPHNPFAKTRSSLPAGVVTLRKLMSHTAGMVREAGIGHYLDDADVSMDEMVEQLKQSSLKEDPDGGTFQYSNAGISVVGYVVQRLAGIAFAEHVRKSVLIPLGMDDSSFVQTKGLRGRLCPASMWTFERDVPAPVFDMGGGGAAGNLFSTIPDMARFVSAMLRGGLADSGRSILRTATLHSMWEPVGRNSQRTYGLTFGLGSLDGWRTVGHSGAVYGYSTQLLFLPEADLGVVLCATLDAVNGVVDRLGRYGLRLGLAARGIGGRPEPPPRYRPVPKEALACLPGDFVDPTSGERVRVAARGDRLYLLIDGLPLRLQATSSTEFVVDGRAFGPGSDFPHLQVEFLAGKAGEPDALCWRNSEWVRSAASEPEAVPREYAPFVGEYGPDFNVAYVFCCAGQLKCRIEYFSTHTLEKRSERTFTMHGRLYDDEILEFDARDDLGRTGIRVGPMFLARRTEA